MDQEGIEKERCDGERGPRDIWTFLDKDTKCIKQNITWPTRGSARTGNVSCRPP